MQGTSIYPGDQTSKPQILPMSSGPFAPTTIRAEKRVLHIQMRASNKCRQSGAISSAAMKPAPEQLVVATTSGAPVGSLDSRRYLPSVHWTELQDRRFVPRLSRTDRRKLTRGTEQDRAADSGWH